MLSSEGGRPVVWPSLFQRYPKNALKTDCRTKPAVTRTGRWPCRNDSADRANRSASTVFEYGFPHLFATSISSFKSSGYSHGLGEGSSPVANDVSSVTGAW